MRKTSVYLSEDEAAALSRAAAASGVSRSELIREGVRQVAASHTVPSRTFHSLGKGHGGGTARRSWTSDELYQTARRRE